MKTIYEVETFNIKSKETFGTIDGAIKSIKNLIPDWYEKEIRHLDKVKKTGTVGNTNLYKIEKKLVTE